MSNTHPPSQDLSSSQSAQQPSEESPLPHHESISNSHPSQDLSLPQSAQAILDQLKQVEQELKHEIDSIHSNNTHQPQSCTTPISIDVGDIAQRVHQWLSHSNMKVVHSSSPPVTPPQDELLYNHKYIRNLALDNYQLKEQVFELLQKCNTLQQHKDSCATHFSEMDSCFGDAQIKMTRLEQELTQLKTLFQETNQKLSRERNHNQKLLSLLKQKESQIEEMKKEKVEMQGKFNWLMTEITEIKWNCVQRNQQPSINTR